MLKRHSKDYYNLIKCVNLPHFIISRREILKGVYETIYMIAINDEQETTLDKKRPIVAQFRGETITIANSQVILYGSIDISSTGEDYRLLEQNTTIVNQDCMEGGKWIPAEYMYENHCCLSNTKYQKIAQTWNAAEIIQYGHGCIGKPDKVAIFKKITNGHTKRI